MLFAKQELWCKDGGLYGKLVSKAEQTEIFVSFTVWGNVPEEEKILVLNAALPNQQLERTLGLMFVPTVKNDFATTELLANTSQLVM